MRRSTVRGAVFAATLACAFAPLSALASTDTTVPVGDDTTAPASGDSSAPAGSDGSVPVASDVEGTVAFLMPDIASTRYELSDAPLFTARMGELCPNCDVIYLDADADPATQQEQANSVLSQGADVIVLDPVDSTAAATIVNAAQEQGVPIIAYDRPIPDAAADFYVSFDNFAIGAAITQSLVDHLDAEGAEGGVLQVNGSPTDAAAGLIGDGIHSVLDESGYEILAEFDTPGWQPPEAQNR